MEFSSKSHRRNVYRSRYSMQQITDIILPEYFESDANIVGLLEVQY
jgi:hypothetical protein